mgnify:FL=1
MLRIEQLTKSYGDKKAVMIYHCISSRERYMNLLDITERVRQQQLKQL